MSDKRLLRQFRLDDTCLQQYSDGSKVKIKIIKLTDEQSKKNNKELINRICNELKEKRLYTTLTDEELAFLKSFEDNKNKED